MEPCCFGRTELTYTVPGCKSPRKTQAKSAKTRRKDFGRFWPKSLLARFCCFACVFWGFLAPPRVSVKPVRPKLRVRTFRGVGPSGTGAMTGEGDSQTAPNRNPGLIGGGRIGDERRAASMSTSSQSEPLGGPTSMTSSLSEPLGGFLQ